MKICYIWAGERGPFDLCNGHQKTVRPKRGTSPLGVLIKSVSFFLICLYFQRFTWENVNSWSTVEPPLEPNLCQGWGIFDRWHEVPVFKRLPLGTELAVVVCHSSGENPAMSAIWEKKKQKRESVAWVKSLKKNYFLFVASVYCTESQRGHVWTILHLAEVSVSLVGEIS